MPAVKDYSAEWVVLCYLENWTVQDFQTAIEKDVDLVKLVLENQQEASLLGDFAELWNPEWTLSDVLFWFAERRPDIYPTLVTPKGLVWLNKHFVRRTEIQQTLIGAGQLRSPI